MSGFSFSFSGDDIEESSVNDPDPEPLSTYKTHAAETGSLRRAPAPAFPIAGQALLAPESHDFESMIKALPSKISYGMLAVTLDDGSQISIPRRELWDVRLQLMAEDDDEGLKNLGQDDVKTGVYEGGFKSWESSVDVVKVLHGRRESFLGEQLRVLEVCSC
jgi:protein-histidine N-methyltransferase